MHKRIQKYDVHLNNKLTGEIHVAKLALQEESGSLSLAAFRYNDTYLNHPNAFPLDPIQLPLGRNDIMLRCRGNGIPGFLDDYLPDDWGKKVLAQLAFYQQKQRIRASSPIELLSMLSTNRIGALCIIEEGASPTFEHGAEISQLENAEQTAGYIMEENYEYSSIDEYSLIYLGHAGSGVGGARPKALISENGNHYLAKFNSLSQDSYNNARVELACLKMAKQAGLKVLDGKIQSGINGRETLLLERFDISGKHRNHLISINALLKNKDTQQDQGGAFRYDDIADLIKKWSIKPREDLEFLLRQMLFNSAMNNTDDHERNFSFINSGDGYHLSPAYDMVPSLAMGQYHIAGFQYSPFPPRPSEAKGRIFGLPSPTVNRICEEVSTAVLQWRDTASEVGVSETDIKKISKVIKV